ncbi:MAG: glycosyltransferase family 39 protein [Candidatus Omnitrophica bacterium]|nr:glycosyltransferase family 39 protein [Candidatus Omnitrophota bacterium]
MTGILFFLIFLLQITANFVWLSYNKLIPVCDIATDFTSTIKYLELLQHPTINIFKDISQVVANDYFRLPFAKLVILPFLYFLPKNMFVATVVMDCVFWLILLLSVFYLGKLIKDEKTGLLACFIVSMYPGLFSLSRVYLVDFPLVAMVTLFVFTLIGLLNSSKSYLFVLFAIGFIGGNLTKCNFSVFIIGALIYFLFKINFSGSSPATHKINRLLFLSSVFLLIYYCSDLSGHLTILQWQGWRGILEGEPSFTQLSGWVYYIKAIISDISIFYSFLFLIGALFINKIKKEFKWILILWIISSYVIMTIFRNKDLRYIMPVLPALALITSFGLLSIPRLAIKRVLIFLVVIFGLTQLYFSSFGKVSLHPSRLIVDIESYEWINCMDRRPPETWKVDKVLSAIEDDWKKSGAKGCPLVMSCSNHIIYQTHALKYFTYIYNKKINFLDIQCLDSGFIKRFGNDLIKQYAVSKGIFFVDGKESCKVRDILFKKEMNIPSYYPKDISQVSYLICDTSKVDPFHYITEGLDFIHKTIEENKNSLDCIFNDDLPDGERVYCYKLINYYAK